MLFLRSVTGVVYLVAVTSAVAAPDQQPSAANQLSQLLGPVVEGAVLRALAAERAAQQLCAAAAGQRALGRLEERLDQLGREVAELQGALTAGTERCGNNSGQPPPEESETESEPACERQPLPLAADSSPHQPPERRACARSCLQLRGQGGSPRDGVYWFTGMPVPVLCDFSHDDGGWTLLLTAVSQRGWDTFSVLGRSTNSPSLTDNYSILRHADAIRDLANGTRFAYRIEAQAETGRRRWGGIWFAPRRYSFIDETATQTDVLLARRFDLWTPKDKGIEQRMPWINSRGEFHMFPVLTTTSPGGDDWWGTLVSHESYNDFEQSAWIHPEARSSGTVLYWVKEEWLDA
ncbi:hypothetical protein FJT64_011229 [Amphibalanus amphitrite]|uniref:Fibrinogen C-terminal domain-containing protein n=1 Tax=Amphibalanus amphitrite TaxID=1232801 RepID=A0A6A4VGA5_AMPAM|nr:hypothetical protein FJT64_011229 [Amphibalanus amphitrite]